MQYSYTKFLTELGFRLKHMRKERGWTLRDMIVLHGVHLTHWQSFEKGKAISVPSLLRVCEIFDMPLETLVAGLGRGEDVPEPSAQAAPAKTMRLSRKGSSTASGSASSPAAFPLARP